MPKKESRDDWRRKANLCNSCGELKQDYDIKFLQCTACRNKHAQYLAVRRAEKRKVKVCIDCDLKVNPDISKTYCEFHSTENKKRVARHRQKLVDKGLCKKRGCRNKGVDGRDSYCFECKLLAKH